MDEVMWLAEPIHGTGQDTQTGDEGQQNCPSRGQPASECREAQPEVYISVQLEELWLILSRDLLTQCACQTLFVCISIFPIQCRPSF